MMGDFNELDVLLPYQKAWVADTAALKIAEKSRRTGLTWAEAADAVLTAGAAKGEGGSSHYYVGSGKEMAEEFIEACAMWAKAFNRAASEVEEELLADEDKDILTYTIKFASGYKIQALSSRPSNMRGRQGRHHRRGRIPRAPGRSPEGRAGAHHVGRQGAPDLHP